MGGYFNRATFTKKITKIKIKINQTKMKEQHANIAVGKPRRNTKKEKKRSDKQPSKRIGLILSFSFCKSDKRGGRSERRSGRRADISKVN